MPNTPKSHKSEVIQEIRDNSGICNNPNFKQCASLLKDIHTITGRTDILAYISSRDSKSYSLSVTIVYNTPVE